MNAPGIVVKCFCIITFIIIVTFGIEKFVPLVAQQNFTTVITPYKDLLIRNGGLTDNQIDELVNELRNINGLQNITTDITQLNTAKYKQEIYIKVKADYKFNFITGYITRKNSVYPFLYERIYPNRKVIN